jgi:peptide/nickel transport system substrate-binding protein
MLRSLAVALLLSLGGGAGYAQEATGEAPQLAALVAGGHLPPLAERLPAEPLVIEPNEELGTYGGTWRLAMNGVGDRSSVMTAVDYEPLLRYSPDIKQIVPNVASSIDVSEDARTYTVHLRKGMRWSDGDPFDADDFMFWYEDVLTEPLLTPTAPEWLSQNGAPAKFTKIDQQTFTIGFEQPNGLFMDQLPLLRILPAISIVVPSHYLRHYLPKYTPIEQLNAEAAASSFDSWQQLFAQRNDPMANPDRPTINAWRLTQGMGQGESLKYERNPYYWKIDPAGNQLPYIDDVSVAVAQNQEVILAKAVNGEIDNQYWHLTFVQNKPVLSQNPDLRFYDAVDPHTNSVAITLNLNSADPQKRQVFNDRNFRVALSVAIDRNAINDLVFLGRATPWQVAPVPGSNYYNEALGTQYLEYDPDEARRILDEAGYKRDAEGFILQPDGKRLELGIITSNHKQERVDSSQLITQYWNDIGVRTFFLPVDQTLYNERRLNNDFDVSTWVANGGSDNDILAFPATFVPFNQLSSQAMLNAQWRNSGGAQGEAPEGDMLKVTELYNQILVLGDRAEQERLMREILDINQKNFWVFGIVMPPLGIGVAKNDFRNTTAQLVDVTEIGGYGPTKPEQFFWKKN